MRGWVNEQSLEQVLVQINALNRSLEGIIEVSARVFPGFRSERLPRLMVVSSDRDM